MEPSFRLQPQSIGDLFDNAVRLYRAHFTTFFGIVAVLLVPITILKLLAESALGGSALIDTLQGLLINNLAAGVLAIAVSRIYLRQPISIGGAYRQGLRHLLTLIASSLAVGLLMLGLLIPFFACTFFLLFSARSSSGWVTLALVPLIGLPALWLLARYTLVTQAVVLEQLGATAALKRSWQLTRQSFWRILAMVLAVSILTYLLSSLPALLLGWAAGMAGNPGLFSGARIAGVVIGQIGLMLAMPIQLVVYTLMYYDLRVRYEGYDLELLGQQLAGIPSAEPAL